MRCALLLNNGAATSSVTVALDRSLDSAIGALSLPGLMIGYRVISPGDEHALMPEEAAAFAASVVTVRRASGAARIAARRLLAKLGITGWALPKGQGGAPVWPPDIVGSMSHDSRVAVAAIARRCNFTALGIDIEPAEALPSDLLDLVATPQERAAIGEDPYQGRLLFAAKEAVYKAVYPLDRIFLDHHDVQVSLSRHQAVVRNGRTVQLMFSAGDHLVVVAFLPAMPDHVTEI
jgi:4'-phosphopantetheinyl transferase EntD